MRKFGFLFCVWLITLSIFAQEQKKLEWSFGVQNIQAFLFIHDKAISYMKGTRANGIQIDLNRVRLDETAFSYAQRKFNSGFSLQFMHFNNPLLGNALNASYFMEPFLIDKPRFSLRVRAAGGLGYATNPFNTNTVDSDNITYSTHINGYLGLGLMAYVKAGKKINIFASATYSHFSNGNVKNPNLGVNFPNVGIGLNYTFLKNEKPIGKLFFYPEKWRFDLILFGSNKSLSARKHMRFWVYGMGAQVTYKSGKIHGWTFAAEALEDLSNKFYLGDRYWDRDLNSKMAGLMIGHEFLFNRCIFSQQLGYWVFKDNPEFFRAYHRWGISYKLNKEIRVGLNLNASLQKAYFIDARLTYSLYR